MRKHCFLDFETRSACDLKAEGHYRYAGDSSTQIMTGRWVFDDEPDVGLWRPGLPLPEDIQRHVKDGGIFVAHNYGFERMLWYGVWLPQHKIRAPKREQWACTATLACAMALPRSLGEVAYVLGSKAQKDAEGYRLMLRMCKPKKIYEAREGEAYEKAMQLWRPKITTGLGEATWNAITRTLYLWEWSEEKQAKLESYCADDVLAERDVFRKMRPLPPVEQRLFVLDSIINDRGFQIDPDTIHHAQRIVDITKTKLDYEMHELTGGFCGPTQVASIVEWLNAKGIAVDSLDKEALETLSLRTDLAPDVKRVLEIRAEASNTSLSKLRAFIRRAMPYDMRVRGSTMMYGASTGRWISTGSQVHNLKRPTGEVDIKRAVEALVEKMNPELFELMFGPPLTALSECMRGMIVAGKGHDLLVADYSNIEGRVNAWLHGEQWKVEAFEKFDRKEGRDIYLVAADEMYDKPLGTFTKDDIERQHGKVGELSLGYQGGINAFLKMAKTYKVHITPMKANEIKKRWRSKHPNVEQGWKDMENAAFEAVFRPGEVYSCCHERIKFCCAAGFLWMRLPSGRLLAYARPEIVEHTTVIQVLDDDDPTKVVKKKFTRETVSFWGVNSQTKTWQRSYGYGGHWCENAVQAIARDIMAEAMLRIEDAGYPVILTIHDEIITEPAEDFGSLEDFRRLMDQRPTWAQDCPIATTGWRGKRYKKG